MYPTLLVSWFLLFPLKGYVEKLSLPGTFPLTAIKSFWSKWDFCLLGAVCGLFDLFTLLCQGPVPPVC